MYEPICNYKIKCWIHIINGIPMKEFSAGNWQLWKFVECDLKYNWRFSGFRLYWESVLAFKRLEISLFDHGILVQSHWNVIHKQVCTLLCHLIMAYSVVLRNEIIRSSECVLMLSCEAAYFSGNSSHRHSVALCHSVMCRHVGYRNREWHVFNKYGSLSHILLCGKARRAFTKARPKGKCRKQEL